MTIIDVPAGVTYCKVLVIQQVQLGHPAPCRNTIPAQVPLDPDQVVIAYCICRKPGSFCIHVLLSTALNRVLAERPCVCPVGLDQSYMKRLAKNARIAVLQNVKRYMKC